jgi:hypothetical protein
MPHPRSSFPLLVLGLVFGAAACSREQPLLFCHNGNCAQPTSPSSDDTLAALADSLALRYRGRPVIDGVELDLTWDGPANGGAGRCAFSHHVTASAPAALEAAQLIVRHLESQAITSWNGEWFHLQLELKRDVDASGASHSPAQALAHVGCALDVIDSVEGAVTEATRVEFIVDSGSGQLLRALADHPRWLAKRPGPAVRYRTAMDFLDPTPISFALQSLADFPPVTDVVFHPNWVTQGQWQAIRSMGIDVTLWMCIGSDVTLSGIQRFEPRAVITNDVMFLRRWEED